MMALSRRWAPFIILLAGITASLLAALWVARIEAERRDARTADLADGVVAAIEQRLTEQGVLLRGVAALFHASDRIVRADFASYVERLRLAQNSPGVLGVGYAEQVTDLPARDALIRRMAAEGVPGFRLWPEPDGYPASAILFLEPRSAANRRALGFNMYGEPTRRAAMARALRTGRAALSGRVALVQDASRQEPGFLLYVPVGRAAGARPGSAASANNGWAYSPLRARELFGAALSRPDLAGAAVEVFDGSPRAANLLYRRGRLPAAANGAIARRIDFAGRRWTVRVAPGPAALARQPLSGVWAVFLGGALLSLLLAALARQQAQAAARTEAEVRRATAELRRANEELIAASRAREAAEAQLRQMQKVEAIGQLTGGIAHDFNNMLAVIMGNLELAERRADDPERLRRALANARAGATRAADLTHRLLAFGRQQPLMPRVLDLNRLVAGMSELLRRALGEAVRLETAYADDLWPVAVDAGQLENALLNLAVNARDAMPDGGTLTIRTENVALDEAYAAQHEGVAHGNYVRISVSDTGTGMPPEVAARALDPFFTTKEVGRGTGLGLSQVFGFVKQSGGHLKIASEPGQGTLVRIYLPRAHGPVAAPERPNTRSDVPRGRPAERILVVEDEEGVRLTTVEALRELGYTVTHADGGKEALRMLEEGGGASLLLTDIVMAGMNGRVLADSARERFPELRVLFTTGYARDAEGGGAGADAALVRKPFTTAQLAAAVRAALDRSMEAVS